MAYTRFSPTSELYLYLTDHGYECCCCILADHDAPWPTFTSTADAIAHVTEHQAAGHQVPAGTIEALRHDAADNDAAIP